MLPLVKLSRIKIHQHIWLELFWSVKQCLICAYFSPDQDYFFTAGVRNIMHGGLVLKLDAMVYKHFNNGFITDSQRLASQDVNWFHLVHKIHTLSFKPASDGKDCNAFIFLFYREQKWKQSPTLLCKYMTQRNQRSLSSSIFKKNEIQVTYNLIPHVNWHDVKRLYPLAGMDIWEMSFLKLWNVLWMTEILFFVLFFGLVFIINNDINI